MKRAGFTAAACLWVAGCALPYGTFEEEVSAPAFRDAGMSVEQARGAIVAGKSTKAEVVSALGSATVIRFDSGYEVWVYRANSASEQGKSELIVLFDPAGLVKKSRIHTPG